MSHFSVYVIGDNVEEQLQPYHEFECTGEDDQYIQDVDITEETRQDYLTEETKQLKGPNGDLFDPYDNQFYREPTAEEQTKIGGTMGTTVRHGLSVSSKDWGDGRGYRPKVRFVPDGYEEITVKRSETQSFLEFISDWRGLKPKGDGDSKYGYVELDENGEVLRVIDRTNPNARWDWWSVGGRWTGALTPDYDPEKDPANIETCFICHGTGRRDDAVGQQARLENPEYTCNGCNGEGKSTKWPTNWRPHQGDQLTLKQFRENLPVLRAQKIAAMLEQRTEMLALVDGLALEDKQIPEWPKEGSPAEAYKAFWDTPVVRALNHSPGVWLTGPEIASLRDDEAATIASAELHAAIPYAMVKDSQWMEKGKMGWFGCSSNEMDEDAWAKAVHKVLESLPDDEIITVIDCHI